MTVAGGYTGTLVHYEQVVWIIPGLARRPCCIIASAFVAGAGYVSAFAPTVGILMASRFVVGLGVGAAFVPVDMLAEACPEAGSAGCCSPRHPTHFEFS